MSSKRSISAEWRQQRAVESSIREARKVLLLKLLFARNISESRGRMQKAVLDELVRGELSLHAFRRDASFLTTSLFQSNQYKSSGVPQEVVAGSMPY